MKYWNGFHGTRRRGSCGALALVSVLAAWLVVAVPSALAQKYKVLYTFQCGADGANPNGALVSDSAGNLYGTTSHGGTNNMGTVFELSADGTETVLHSFAGFPTDGAGPLARLVRDAAGNLYGTTFLGGAFDLGTVFEVSANGTETVLHSFGNAQDGANPLAGLVQDSAGNLYGTTLNGGLTGHGVVFGLTVAGVEGVIYSFNGRPDGANPSGDLVRDATGSLHGTTQSGGAFGHGTVFKIAKGRETILHSFLLTDGVQPQAGLIFDKTGNLYGTTAQGGAGNGAGVVFKLDPTGTEAVLFTFSNVPFNANGGYAPVADLLSDANGNLYGTTEFGGSSPCAGQGCGVVFEVNPVTGQEAILHSFSGPPDDGQAPLAGLFAQAGKLYGTTQLGGASSCGTVFGVKPVIATEPDSR